MAFRFVALVLLQLACSCLSIELAQARSGGDLAVCSVEVEGNSLTMGAGFRTELGANGESICKRFFLDTGTALELRTASEMAVDGGTGMSAEDPIDIGVDNAERNWMISVLTHFSGVAQGGRYQDFVLISRPDDRFVVQVSVGLADGSVVARYYEYSAWVAPQLD